MLQAMAIGAQGTKDSILNAVSVATGEGENRVVEEL